MTVLGTVRFRITAIATLAALVVLSIAGAALVAAQRRILTDNVEDAVRSEMARLARIVALDPLPDPLPPSVGDDLVGQVVLPSGRVVASTANLSATRPIGALPTGAEESAWRSVAGLPGHDDPYRVASRRVSGPEGTRIVMAGAGLDDVRESTRTLTTLLWLTIPLVAATLAALVWWLVGRTLRPVEDIRRDVADIEATDLSQRVPVPPGSDEIARLARTMNAMLERLGAANARQAQFVADASHELRGPLTRMRSELEVDRAHPETADARATGDSVLHEVTNLQRLVDDLLLLARSDAGVALGRTEIVDLDDVVLRDVARLRVEARVEVDARGVSAVQVEGDPEALARVVRNLTDNAARHAASRVTLTLEAAGGAAVLSIADDGSGIPVEDRDRVFERFTRLDDARTAGGGGTGLGLAIAREVVTRHGGTIRIESVPATGTRFVVTVPNVRGGPDDADDPDLPA